ncbi:MAG: valine--tRNA ligase [Chthoniobacteraceae bacterium]
MPELAKTYEPASVEERWYAAWLEQGCFTARPERVSDQRPAYSIVIPPPNVTGVLTLGHVLNNTIQDILARRARMLGKEVLWLPGTDHAGIATQTVVERTLKKQGVIRHRDDLGREKFLEKVWEWKDKHGGIIIQQLKKLGASCDWSRERFTMDPEYSRCVSQVFVELYKKGLIYRGKRMVNWCPVSLTALSDEEVTMKPQNSTMFHFREEVAELPGTWLTIATTRPEVIPGDTAVAVNPKDERYAHLIGKHVIRPLPVNLPADQKLIPIIGDEHVDFEFGTGVLKVTPAHDMADFEIAQRHNLPVIDVMNPDGTMNALAGESLVGLDRFEARNVAVDRLRELGVLDKEEPYQNNVGYSERADVPIEPRLSEQWFLKYPSVAESKACVAEGRMKFFPDRWAKVYDHWMENIRDWCISRQLWWGHRVPVWYRGDETYCGIDAPEGDGWTQDTDVLDTWFSSWLWPFATMGWPEKTDTLAKFYPTTDLVTGPDIIFFWVARMIMAGHEFMGELPFRNVYFTGIIRDKQGRKMSKSLGNSPDPLDLIAKFGADALRFGVMRSAPLGTDVTYDEKNVELGRNFCTKLWNAARFRQMQGGEHEAEIIPRMLTADDKWILLQLDRAVQEVTRALEQYRFSDATATLYRFFWSEFCDWYLEASKAALTSDDDARRSTTLAVLDFVLSHTLRLFHPFMPFITEELWHGLGYCDDMPADQGGRTIMNAPWPKPLTNDERHYMDIDPSHEEFAQQRYEVVNAGRGLRRDFNIASSKRVRFVLRCGAGYLTEHDHAVLELLLAADPLDLADAEWQAPKGTPVALTPLGELLLPLEGLIDASAERDRLTKEIAKVEQELGKVRAKLADTNFAGKVPPQVLAEHRQREETWAQKLEQFQRMLEALG